MSSIKKLAGQTVWYGASSAIARFISFLLTPILTYSAVISTADYGRMSALYAAIPLMNIIFTYGMETAYFRFMNSKEASETVHATSIISILFTTFILFFLLWTNAGFFATLTALEFLPLLLKLSFVIIALDALATIPFAALRNENRPRRFAFVKIAGTILNVLLTLFFIGYCSSVAKSNPNSWVLAIYNPSLNPIVYVLFANVAQSALVLILLSRRLLPTKWRFDFNMWKQMIYYASPMLVVGLAGTINDTFDRLMLGWWLPGTDNFINEQRGIYNACCKLAMLITLFIQAFRMGAEPFFFKEAADEKNPQRTYARVMKFFVIILCFMFLMVSLYLPILKYFIAPKYWVGIKIVPVLLLANVALGIYYNLSVWYKITNNTMAGALITMAGALITIIIDRAFIPLYSYTAAAWATCLCYFTMMLLSFIWGQKKYPVPYAWKKLVAYIVIVLILFFIHKGVSTWLQSGIVSFLVATGLLYLFARFIFLVERKEIARMPLLSKLFLKRKNKPTPIPTPHK